MEKNSAKAAIIVILVAFAIAICNLVSPVIESRIHHHEPTPSSLQQEEEGCQQLKCR